MAPLSGQPPFAIMAVPIFILTSESPPLRHVLGVLSDHYDKRNLALSTLAGDRCRNKPSPFLPCLVWNDGMDETRPASLEAGMRPRRAV